MDRVFLVLKVFLLVFTSEVLSKSVAEILFDGLEEKLDNSLLKINERLDRLEQLVEQNGFNTDKGDNVKDGMGKGKDIHSEIMKANKRFKNAMSHEKQHVRLMLEEYGNEFREVRKNVNHVLSEFNISMQATKDNMVDKMALKAVQDRVAGNNQDHQQSDIRALDKRVTSFHDVQDNTIKKLMGRMTSFNSQIQSDISSLDNRVTTLNDQRVKNINSLTSRITTLHEQKVRFHVSLSTKREYRRGSKIVFDHEHYNPESAYSKSTGKFTAPYTGTYLLSMSVEGTSNKQASAALIVNRITKMWTKANKGEEVISSNTCIIYMFKGEQAWVVSVGDSKFDNFGAQFTGVFLY